tara:strand:- start:3184 stop:3486 length:303 start_codon:yes stop_codon:yes gene_type:complete
MGSKLLDQYTYLHFATGIILYYWGISLKSGLLLHTLFELFENSNLGIIFINSYFGIWPGGKPYADTLINTIGDTLGFAIGWYSAFLLDNIGNKHNLYIKA